MWRNKLQDVFGADLSVKLDLFHAVQRVIKKIPKRDPRGRTLKFIRQRMINDLRMVFGMSSDIGPTRMNDTPSPAEMLKNIDNFLKKWKNQKHEEDNVLPSQAVEELNKLKKHVEKGCLSGIPPSGGTNRNEALHKTLRKNISRQRIGVQLALALLGISFFIWNEKRSPTNSGTKKTNSSIQTYYSSFLATSKVPTTERFGISASENGRNMDENQKDIYCCDYSGNLDGIFNNDSQENDHEDYESDEHEDLESLSNHPSVSESAILNTVFLKMNVVLDLSKKTNNNPYNLAKDIHFMKSTLLLLSNSKFNSHEDTCFKLNAVLKAYGFERVPVAKDGNCLFASASLALAQLLNNYGCSAELRKHLYSIGICNDKSLPELIETLRKLVVEEFLSCNVEEYSSFLLTNERLSYEETAKKFLQDGFFDCELGNAVILALSNILRSSVIVFTSLENYPIITIVPENDPLSKVPVYLAFEQTGPGHYDGVTEITQGTEDLDNIENLRETKTTNTEDIQSNILPKFACRCGKGAARNKVTRQFCLEYKSGCKCYQNLRGCTSDCACYNCGNNYGARVESSDMERFQTPKPRKRRKHGLGKETGRQFMIGRGEDVTSARWSLFEKLLCIECALNMENTDDVEKLTVIYNSVIDSLKNGTLKCPDEFVAIVDLQTIERRERKSVESILKRLYDENNAFNEGMKQQIELNVL